MRAELTHGVDPIEGKPTNRLSIEIGDGSPTIHVEWFSDDKRGPRVPLAEALNFLADHIRSERADAD